MRVTVTIKSKVFSAGPIDIFFNEIINSLIPSKFRLKENLWKLYNKNVAVVIKTVNGVNRSGRSFIRKVVKTIPEAQKAINKLLKIK